MNSIRNSSNLATLGKTELARLLDKSPTTIQADVYRRPESLPPRLIIPGSKRLLWLQDTVVQWLNERVQSNQAKRINK